MLPETDKSFLLLFFKKEAFLPAVRREPRRLAVRHAMGEEASDPDRTIGTHCTTPILPAAATSPEGGCNARASLRRPAAGVCGAPGP